MKLILLVIFLALFQIVLCQFGDRLMAKDTTTETDIRRKKFLASRKAGKTTTVFATRTTTIGQHHEDSHHAESTHPASGNEGKEGPSK